MIDTSAKLIAVTYTGNLGAMQRTETPTSIFCKLMSVDRTEYYNAYNSGFKPEFKVVTDPVNYSGQTIIEVDTPEGTVKCDIYRTYRKSLDQLELWCVKQNPEAVQTFTLWTAGKKVTLFGCYMLGSDGVDRTETGSVATDTVRLILPQTFQAFVGTSPVTYCKPKAYNIMTAAAQATHFYIDSHCFFALGNIDAVGTEKYQAVNSQYDDVYLVQSVAVKVRSTNRAHPDTEYLEVVGK